MNQNKKILVAEDDQFISKIMAFNLKESGYQVDLVHDGDEAKNLIDQNNYQLILTDLIMPGATGFDLLKLIKEKGISTPVLVFSNLSQENDKKEALSLGAKNYFVKSDISIDELISKVNEYL